MDKLAKEPETGLSSPPIEIMWPEKRTMPFVFASPHSGSHYPADFVAASRLDPISLRRSEDSFVDDLFATAPDHGAPLLKAHFPRAYVDPNREAYELDPAMFEETLPDYVNTKSVRVSAGLGTIARVVTNGEEIYDGKLKFADAIQRVESTYTPYHSALKQLIAATKSTFGVCFLVDCHSMPSIGGPMDDDHGKGRVDIVLGNNHGNACAAELMAFADDCLTGLGLAVRRNNPYSGGFTTRHYGQPKAGVHALQIEINRSLYMNEDAIERNGGFAELKECLNTLVTKFADFSL